MVAGSIQKVSVRVPASTSNLGPGFDCLGIALHLHNLIVLEHGSSGARRPAIVDQTARMFFRCAGLRPFDFTASIDDRVPRSRGLGSSATARLGVLHGLNELTGRPLERSELFDLAAKLEGHPDNAAPASFGGFTVVRRGSKGARGHVVQRFNVSPRVRFVLLLPDYEVRTSAARKTLPAKISRFSAVENSANVAAITAAFASGDYKQLQGAFADHLHQPFRRRLNPVMIPAIRAAERAGALGAFLSGSGSTICAVTLHHEDKVAASMLRSGGKRARVIITRADNAGIRIRTSKFSTRN